VQQWGKIRLVEDAAVVAMRDAAVLATGLDDFGDDWFMGPLSAWAADLKQPCWRAP
jgi:hypothetical protein